MTSRSEKGWQWFKTISMWAGFFAVGKAVFGIFSADPGHSIAMAFMIFIGSVVMLAIPAYVIGWLTGGSDGQGDAAHGIPAPIVTRNSAIRETEKPSRATAIPVSQATNTLPDDTQLFGLVARELTINKRDEALWTMAFALEGGNESATKAHYIRLRVAQLKNGLSNNKPSPVEIDASTLAPDHIKIDRHRSQILDEPPSTDMMDAYSAVVGEKNLDYYLSKFAKFDAQASGQFIDWQWFAFLFPFAWALYRKLYGWAIVFFVLNAAANASAKSFESAIKRQGGVEDGYGGLYVYLVVMFVPSLLFGVFANSLYWKKCLKAIAQARTTNRDQTRALGVMRANGGVNGWVPKVAVAIPIIGICLAILLPKFQGKKDISAAPTSAQAPQDAYDFLDKPVASPAAQSQQNPFDALDKPVASPAATGHYDPLAFNDPPKTQRQMLVGNWTCSGRRGSLYRRFTYSLNSDGTMTQTPLGSESYESPISWQIDTDTSTDVTYLTVGYASKKAGGFVVTKVTDLTLSLTTEDRLSTVECSR